jgi:cytosine/adenosine deaminase-related metal-dependent hydrolase
LLRARIVAPVAGPAIENGAVLIAGDRIEAVGRANTLRGESRQATMDLGEVILMPGLINGHCHLDYTDMAGQIPSPECFPDWIKSILALKASRMFSDYAAAWFEGARMLLRHGTTTVINVESVPLLLPEARSATPLRVCSLLELTGLRNRRNPAQLLCDATEAIDSLKPSPGWAGLSPHAPYSTPPGVLRLAAETAREMHWPVATHVAESAEELEMFVSRRGPMFDWLKEFRDMSDCDGCSPVQHLLRQRLLSERFMAVHANYLRPGDAEALARAGANVVHCPRSHAYFGHRLFPYETLAKAGINICLGTDSLASVRTRPGAECELDLFEEMRALAERQPRISPRTIVRLATVNGARALGKTGELGELSPHSRADMVALPYSGGVRGVWGAIVRHHGPVPGVMIGGRWVCQPSEA